MNLSILARHTIAAIGGILAHHGVVADTHSTASIIGGIIVVIISLLWSLVEKAEMADETKDIVKKLAAALASQAVAALAGWLQADAATAADPEALLLFLGNTTLSHARGHVPPAKLSQWLLLFAASAFLCGHLTSCSTQSQDAFEARLKAAGESIATAVSISALESTLITLRSELTTLMIKPVDEDPTQQLLDQARIQAVKELIRAGESQLTKLKAPRRHGVRTPPSASIQRPVAFPKLGLQVAAHLASN